MLSNKFPRFYQSITAFIYKDFKSMTDIAQPILKSDQAGHQEGCDLETPRPKPEEVPVLMPSKKRFFLHLLILPLLTLLYFVLYVVYAPDLGKAIQERNFSSLKDHKTFLLPVLTTLFFYFKSALFGSTMKYLSKMRTSSQLEEIFRTMRNSTPKFGIVSKCSHWETTNKIFMIFSFKFITPKPMTNNERGSMAESKLVVSQNNFTTQNFRSVQDRSPDLTDEWWNCKIVKLTFKSEVVFANSDTEAAIDNELKLIRKNDKDKDLNHSAAFKSKMEGFDKKILMMTSKFTRIIFNKYLYFVMTCFMLAWPYSVILDWASKRGRVTIRKAVAL
jgi:hypothetical protein